MSPFCAECNDNKDVSLTLGSVIYPHRPDLHSESFWHCKCGAYVGCHPNTIRALGTCAGPGTRKLRSKVHAEFDPIWKDQGVPQQEAYARMAHALGMTIDQCHIGLFTISDCHKALAWLRGFAKTPKQPLPQRACIRAQNGLYVYIYRDNVSDEIRYALVDRKGATFFNSSDTIKPLARDLQNVFKGQSLVVEVEEDETQPTSDFFQHNNNIKGRSADYLVVDDYVVPITATEVLAKQREQREVIQRLVKDGIMPVSKDAEFWWNLKNVI